MKLQVQHHMRVTDMQSNEDTRDVVPDLLSCSLTYSKFR